MKVWKWLGKIVVKIIAIFEEDEPVTHEDPIPVDPPIKPKEEEM